MNSTDRFETIVSEHYEPLFRFAISLTHAESDARDLTQQTFYVWAAKGHQLRDITKVKTWLFTTLHRAFLKARRRESRFPHQDLEEIPDHLLVASTAFAGQSDCSQVLSALAKVDDVYQGAVALFYLEDSSYSEIGAILEVPVGTVKSRIARGISQLRQILLPSDARDSLLNREQLSSIANSEEPVPPAKNNSPISCPERASPAGKNSQDFEEWAFSPSRLLELPGS